MSKLIYITSMGHSGSTLTDMWIGRLPNVFSTGEIIFLPWQIWRGEIPDDPQSYCSCGESFKECAFWQKTFSVVKEKTGHDIYESPLEYDISIHSSKFYAGRNFLHSAIHTGLLGLHPLIGNTKIWNIFNTYYNKSISRNWQLFDAISEVSDCDFVTDSSKNFLRYLFLRSKRPKDSKLIILFRNVHGVASSSHHGLNESIIQERAKSWENFYNRISKFVKTADPDEYYFLNYEKLCSDPTQELLKIAKFIGIEEDQVPRDNKIDTKSYHLTAGNPIRNQGELSIRYDQRWKERLTQDQIVYLDEIQDRVERKFMPYVKSIRE